MKITTSTPTGIAGLISRSATAPATGVSVVDAGNRYVGTDVETILAEIGAQTFAATGAMVPYLIASSETFTVPLYKQALFEMPIDNQGTLVVDGFLIMVT